MERYSGGCPEQLYAFSYQDESTLIQDKLKNELHFQRNGIPTLVKSTLCTNITTITCTCNCFYVYIFFCTIIIWGVIRSYIPYKVDQFVSALFAFPV